MYEFFRDVNKKNCCYQSRIWKFEKLDWLCSFVYLVIELHKTLRTAAAVTFRCDQPHTSDKNYDGRPVITKRQKALRFPQELLPNTVLK